MEPLAIGSYLVGVLLLALTFFPFFPMTPLVGRRFDRERCSKQRLPLDTKLIEE